MYRYKILNRIKLDYFLKFIIHELNSEIVKFEMVVLTVREKVDVTVGWKLQPTAGTIVDEMKKKD
jgi:hypothetical protein